MSSLNKVSLSGVFASYLPLLFLFFSVFNDFDFNFLKIENFSFNFAYILIFYWTLRSPERLGYLVIFFAGIINDVVISIPMGISSLSYLFLCSVTAYMRDITLNPNFIKDWFSFLFIIIIINSIQIILLDLVFVIDIDYMRYLSNTGFTFLFYPVFFIVFNFLNLKISQDKYD
jgi:rod shape-determining protein MreD